MTKDGANQTNLTNNGARDFDTLHRSDRGLDTFTSERDGNL